LNVDVDGLRSVVTNLILNALEAMDGEGGEKRLVLGLNRVIAPPADQSVRVGVDGREKSGATAREEIVITVSDTGPGIPNELKEKIFYPFFTTKQSGSGVGLATSQKIVASHGGVLEFDSETGRGCSFRVRIPIEDEKP
jgi:signal transduction histidine kinase